MHNVRAVALLLCLLACCTAPSTAQEVDIPSETIHNPAAAPKAALAGLHSQQQAATAVSPAAAEDNTLPIVRAPAVLSFHNGAGSQDWDIESMVTGDVSDAAGTAAAVGPGVSTTMGGGSSAQQQDTAAGRRVGVAAGDRASASSSSGSSSSIGISSKQKPVTYGTTTQSSSKGSTAGAPSKVDAQPSSATTSSSSSDEDAKGTHTGSKGKGKVTTLASELM
jgi:hypothetical protein